MITFGKIYSFDGWSQNKKMSRKLYESLCIPYIRRSRTYIIPKFTMILCKVSDLLQNVVLLYNILLIITDTVKSLTMKTLVLAGSENRTGSDRHANWRTLMKYFLHDAKLTYRKWCIVYMTIFPMLLLYDNIMVFKMCVKQVQ